MGEFAGGIGQRENENGSLATWFVLGRSGGIGSTQRSLCEVLSCQLHQGHGPDGGTKAVQRWIPLTTR